MSSYCHLKGLSDPGIAGYLTAPRQREPYTDEQKLVIAYMRTSYRVKTTCRDLGLDWRGPLWKVAAALREIEQGTLLTA